MRWTGATTRWLLFLSRENERQSSASVMKGHLHPFYMVSYYVENEQEGTRSEAGTPARGSEQCSFHPGTRIEYMEGENRE